MNFSPRAKAGVIPLHLCMVFRPRPVFANFVLADEINRAPAKVQSALLEAMQEKQVTIGEHPYTLEQPFLVLATQNPIEQEGTYPLPEAQLDRFMMQIMIQYPTPEQEEEILMLTSGEAPAMPGAAFDRASFLALRQLVLSVPVPKSVAAYAVRLCGSSPPMIRVPARWLRIMWPGARARAARRTLPARPRLGRCSTSGPRRRWKM